MFLREIEEKDIKDINSWRGDRDSVENLGTSFNYINLDIDKSWYQSYLNSRDNNVRLAICVDESNLIGVVYLTNINWIHRRAEFSIWIGNKAHQGKGYGKLAAKLMLQHAFNDLNLHSLFLTVLKSNNRAIELYKKIGFIEIGCLPEYLFKDGMYVDMISMSLVNNLSNYKK